MLDSRYNWFWIAVVGQKAPQIVVDEVRATADEFQALGASVAAAGPQIEALRGKVAQILPPDVADQFSKVSRMFSDSMPDLTAGAGQLGEQLDALALDVEKTVYSMIVEVSLLATSAALALLSPFTAPLVAPITTAARLLVSRLLNQLLRAAQLITRLSAGTMSRLTEAAAKLSALGRVLGTAATEAAQEVAQEAGVQAIQVLQGNRHSADTSSLVAAAGMGAAMGGQMGAVAGLAGRFAPKAGSNFFFGGVNEAAAQATVGTSAAAITGQNLGDAWMGPLSGFVSGTAERGFHETGQALGRAAKVVPPTGVAGAVEPGSFGSLGTGTWTAGAGAGAGSGAAGSGGERGWTALEKGASAQPDPGTVARTGGDEEKRSATPVPAPSASAVPVLAPTASSHIATGPVDVADRNAAAPGAGPAAEVAAGRNSSPTASSSAQGVDAPSGPAAPRTAAPVEAGGPLDVDEDGRSVAEGVSGGSGGAAGAGGPVTLAEPAAVSEESSSGDPVPVVPEGPGASAANSVDGAGGPETTSAGAAGPVVAVQAGAAAPAVVEAPHAAAAEAGSGPGGAEPGASADSASVAAPPRESAVPATGAGSATGDVPAVSPSSVSSVLTSSGPSGDLSTTDVPAQADAPAHAEAPATGNTDPTTGAARSSVAGPGPVPGGPASTEPLPASSVVAPVAAPVVVPSGPVVPAPAEPGAWVNAAHDAAAPGGPAAVDTSSRAEAPAGGHPAVGYPAVGHPDSPADAPRSSVAGSVPGQPATTGPEPAPSVVAPVAAPTGTVAPTGTAVPTANTVAGTGSPADPGSPVAQDDPAAASTVTGTAPVLPAPTDAAQRELLAPATAAALAPGVGAQVQAPSDPGVDPAPAVPSNASSDASSDAGSGTTSHGAEARTAVAEFPGGGVPAVTGALAALDPSTGVGPVRAASRVPDRSGRRTEPVSRFPRSMSAEDQARFDRGAAAARAHLDSLPARERDVLHERARRIVTASSAPALPQISGDGRPVQPTPYGQRIGDITAVVATYLQGPSTGQGSASAELVARGLAERFDNPWPTGTALGGAPRRAPAPGAGTGTGSSRTASSRTSAADRRELTDEQNALRQLVPLPPAAGTSGGVIAPRSAQDIARWSATYVAVAGEAGPARPFLVFGSVDESGVQLRTGSLAPDAFGRVLVRSGLDPRDTGPVVLVLDGPRSATVTADLERSLGSVAPARAVGWSTLEELLLAAPTPPATGTVSEAVPGPNPNPNPPVEPTPAELEEEARDVVPALPTTELDPDTISPYLSRGLGVSVPAGFADPQIVSGTVNEVLGLRGLTLLPEHQYALDQAVHRNLADFVGEGRTVSVSAFRAGSTPRDDRGWDVNVRVTFETLRRPEPLPGEDPRAVSRGVRTGTRAGDGSGSSLRRTRGTGIPLQFTAVPGGAGGTIDVNFQEQRVTTSSVQTGSSRGYEFQTVEPGDHLVARTRFDVEVAAASRGGRGALDGSSSASRRTVRSDVELTVPQIRQERLPQDDSGQNPGAGRLDERAAARLAGARTLSVGPFLDTHDLRRRRTELLPHVLTEPRRNMHEYLDDVSAPLALGPGLLEALRVGQPSPPVTGAADSWTSLRTTARIASVRPTYLIRPRQRADTVNELSESVTTSRQTGRGLGVSPTVGIAVGPIDLLFARTGPQFDTSRTSQTSRETTTAVTRGHEFRGDGLLYEAEVVLDEEYYDQRTGRWIPTLVGHPVDVVLGVLREEARALGLPDGTPARAPENPQTAVALRPEPGPGRALPAWESTDSVGRLHEIVLPVDTAARMEQHVRDLLDEIGRGHLLPGSAAPEPHGIRPRGVPTVSRSRARQLFDNHARLTQAVSSRALAGLVPRKVVLRDPHVLHRGPDGTGVLFKDVVTIDIVPSRGEATWIGETADDIVRSSARNATRYGASQARAWTADLLVEGRARFPVAPGVSVGAIASGRAGFGRGTSSGGALREANRGGQFGDGTADFFEVPIRVEVRIRVDRVPHSRPRRWEFRAVRAYLEGAPMPPSGRVLHQSGPAPREADPLSPVLGVPRVVELTGVLGVSRLLTRPGDEAVPGPFAARNPGAPSRQDGDPGSTRAQLVGATPAGPRATAATLLHLAAPNELLDTIRHLAARVVGPDGLRRLDHQLHVRFGGETAFGRFTTDGWSAVLDGLSVTVRPTLSRPRLVDVLAKDTIVVTGEMTGADASVGQSRTRAVTWTSGPFARTRFVPYGQFSAGYTSARTRSENSSVRTLVESWRGRETGGPEPWFVVQYDVRWDVVVERGRRQRVARTLLGEPAAAAASGSYTVENGVTSLVSEDAARDAHLLDDLDEVAAANDRRLEELGVAREEFPQPAPLPPAWQVQAPESLRGGPASSLGAGRGVSVPDARPLLEDLEAALAERGRSVLPAGTADRRDNRQAALKLLTPDAVRSHLASIVDGGVSLPLSVHQDHNRLGELRLAFELGEAQYLRTEAVAGVELSLDTTASTQYSFGTSSVRAHRFQGSALLGGYESTGSQYAQGGSASVGLSAGIADTHAEAGTHTLETGARMEVYGPRAIFSVPVVAATLSFHHPDGHVDAVTRTDLDPVVLEFDTEPLRVVPPEPLGDGAETPARGEAIGPDSVEVVPRADVEAELAGLRARRTELPVFTMVQDVHRSATVRDALVLTQLPTSPSRRLRTVLDDRTAGERSGHRMQEFVSRAMATNDAVRGWLLRANRAPVELGHITAEVAFTGGRVTAVTSGSTAMIMQAPPLGEAPGRRGVPTQTGDTRSVERGGAAVFGPLSPNTSGPGWYNPSGPLSTTATGRSSSTSVTSGPSARQVARLVGPGVIVTFDVEILLDGGHSAGAVRVRMPQAVPVRMLERDAARVDPRWQAPSAARAAEVAAATFQTAASLAEVNRRDAYVAALAVQATTDGPQASPETERAARTTLRNALREQQLAERKRDEAEREWSRAKHAADAALDRRHPRPLPPPDAPAAPVPAPALLPSRPGSAPDEVPGQVATAVSHLLGVPAVTDLLSRPGFTGAAPKTALTMSEALTVLGTAAADALLTPGSSPYVSAAGSTTATAPVHGLQLLQEQLGTAVDLLAADRRLGRRPRAYRARVSRRHGPFKESVTAELLPHTGTSGQVSGYRVQVSTYSGLRQRAVAATTRRLRRIVGGDRYVPGAVSRVDARFVAASRAEDDARISAAPVPDAPVPAEHPRSVPEVRHAVEEHLDVRGHAPLLAGGTVVVTAGGRTTEHARADDRGPDAALEELATRAAALAPGESATLTVERRSLLTRHALDVRVERPAGEGPADALVVRVRTSSRLRNRLGAVRELDRWSGGALRVLGGVPAGASEETTTSVPLDVRPDAEEQRDRGAGREPEVTVASEAMPSSPAVGADAILAARSLRTEAVADGQLAALRQHRLANLPQQVRQDRHPEASFDAEVVVADVSSAESFRATLLDRLRWGAPTTLLADRARNWVAWREGVRLVSVQPLPVPAGQRPRWQARVDVVDSVFDQGANRWWTAPPFRVDVVLSASAAEAAALVQPVPDRQDAAVRRLSRVLHGHALPPGASLLPAPSLGDTAVEVAHRALNAVGLDLGSSLPGGHGTTPENRLAAEEAVRHQVREAARTLVEQSLTLRQETAGGVRYLRISVVPRLGELSRQATASAAGGSPQLDHFRTDLTLDVEVLAALGYGETPTADGPPRRAREEFTVGATLTLPTSTARSLAALHAPWPAPEGNIASAAAGRGDDEPLLRTATVSEPALVGDAVRSAAAQALSGIEVGRVNIGSLADHLDRHFGAAAVAQRVAADGLPSWGRHLHHRDHRTGHRIDLRITVAAHTGPPGGQVVLDAGSGRTVRQGDVRWEITVRTVRNGEPVQVRRRVHLLNALIRWQEQPASRLAPARPAVAQAPRPEPDSTGPTATAPAAGGAPGRTDVLTLPGGRGLLVPSGEETWERITAIADSVPGYDGVDLLLFHPAGRDGVAAAGGVMSASRFADVVRTHWAGRARQPDVVVLVASGTARRGPGPVELALDEQLHVHLGRPVISSDADVWTDREGRVVTATTQPPVAGRVPGRPTPDRAQFFLLDRGRRTALGTAELGEALARARLNRRVARSRRPRPEATPDPAERPAEAVLSS